MLVYHQPALVASHAMIISDGSDEPTYFFDSLIVDTYWDFENPQRRIIGVGLPYYIDQRRYPVSKTGKGKMIIVSLEHWTWYNNGGCEDAQFHAVDVTTYHQDSFYA